MSPVPIEIVFPLALFGTKGAGALIRILQNGRRLRTWREAAGACGLQVMDAARWKPQLLARTGPVSVTIGPSGTRRWSTQIFVGVPATPDSYRVTIRRKSLFQRAGGIEIGESSMDQQFFIQGPTRQVLALLDAETRRLLIEASAERGLVEISSGTLRAQDTHDEKVQDLLPLLLDIGRRLSQPIDVPRRLADNARGDPEPGVRLQNLLALIRELPQAPETLEALRAACSDRSPEVRLRAAQALGAEGRDTLQDLAESLVDDTVSAEAVSALDRELSFERTKAILDHALERHLPRTAHACMEALGEKGASPGQLSVAPPEAGQLSLPHDEAGQLSIAPHAEGQLSLPSEELEQPPPRERESPAGRRA